MLQKEKKNPSKEVKLTFAKASQNQSFPRFGCPKKHIF